jgi:hypothetical protein
MGFLDNSGDIILDAVLTDTGRMRLAKGDGSFQISKFALGDDEIDYSLYRNNNHPDGAHANGTAYADLSILQTPLLEAMTNNTSQLHSKLVTISQLNLFDLPIMMLHTKAGGFKVNTNGTWGASGQGYVLLSDEISYNHIVTELGAASTALEGVINGSSPKKSQKSHIIRVDQGLDTNANSAKKKLDTNLMESQYIVEMDNRFVKLMSPGYSDINFNFVDDDQIASYYVTAASQGKMVIDLPPITSDQEINNYPFKGSPGKSLQFTLGASDKVADSSYYFSLLGNTGTVTIGTKTFFSLDTVIRVTGATTGYKIDIPIRVLRSTTA